MWINPFLQISSYLFMIQNMCIYMYLVKRRSFRISQRNDISKESFNHLPLGKIAFRNIKIFEHHCASLRPISLRISSKRIYRVTDAIEKYRRDMVTVIDISHLYLLI